MIQPDYESLYRIYPQRRKHCSSCKHWRHLCDFHLNTERRLQAKCIVCQKVYIRRLRGYSPRLTVGVQSRAERNRRRRQWNKERMAAIKADPQRHEEYKETRRLEAYDLRRRHGVPVRNLSGPSGGDMRLDRKPFDDWLLGCGYTPKELSVRTGMDEGVFGSKFGSPQILLSTVDTVFTAMGVPHLVAVLWPL